MKGKFEKTVESAILSPGYASQKYIDEYLKPHMQRFHITLRMLGRISAPGMRVIDVGSYGSLVPALKEVLGLTRIVITTPRQKNRPASEDTCLADARNGEQFPFHADRFDLEEPFPYSDETFDIVIFTEVLEHLSVDPMHSLAEINRITKPGGWILLSTPSCTSAKSVIRILRGSNPNCYPVYTKQPSRDRHNREYTPWEVRQLLAACGYEVTTFDTIDVYSDQSPAWWLIKAGLWLSSRLSLGIIEFRARGDTIFALGKKISGIENRYPDFLYV
jgi:SAM-dependent methyltransferase